MKQIKPKNQEIGIKLMNQIINVLGERSAKSQALKQVITSTTKFNGTDQRIYIKISGSQALGFIKVG
jgi:hypothetical protein